MKLLLELRNKLKAKMPKFIRHDAHKKKRVGTGWRRPKGIQNKMRLHRKGYARDCSTGFGSPKAVHSLSRDGLKQNLIHNSAELASLNPKSDGVIVARTIGDRKRSIVIKEATEKGFTLLNITVEKFTKKQEEKTAMKSEHKKSLDKKKQEKSAAKVKEEKKKAEAKAKAKESEKSTLSDEDKKAQEKKELDKVLTKKGGEQ
jgi:large subunit ribosomal protein L32e